METSYQTIEVNKDWIIKNVDSIAWQRKLYPGRVNKFINHLKNGTFRPNSLIVGYIDNNKKFRIIDGQHKLEAIKITNIPVKLDFRVLKNVSEDEMMDEYESGADVKHHRNIDIIKLYIEGKKHDWLAAFLDERHFPINVSMNGGVNSLKIDNLLKVIYNGINRRQTMFMHGLDKSGFKKFLESIDAETYSITKEFFSIYKECFGDPSKDNWMYRPFLITTLMRIWLANIDDYSKSEIIEAFKKIELSSEIRQSTAQYSNNNKTLLEASIRKIYKTINKGRSINKFIIFWDEEMVLTI